MRSDWCGSEAVRRVRRHPKTSKGRPVSDEQYLADMAAAEAKYAAEMDRIDKEYRSKVQVIVVQFAAGIISAMAIGGAFSYAAAGAVSWWFLVLVVAAIVATYIHMGVAWRTSNGGTSCAPKSPKRTPR